MIPVVIMYDGKDRHGIDCRCGLCNSNGHAYTYAIFDANGVELDNEETREDNLYELISDPDKKIKVVMAPSETSAEDLARYYCEQNGLQIVGD
jgi:hypothetical protein